MREGGRAAQARRQARITHECGTGSDSGDQQRLLDAEVRVVHPRGRRGEGAGQGGADGIGKDTGKLEILEGEDKSLHSDHTPIGSQQLALNRINDELKGLGFPQPVAIGHRIVHGGPRLRDHVRITPDVIAALEASVHFAPVHMQHRWN